MELSRPLFSIITVCYNAEATLPITLESVASQTCDLYEHIIIDGLSTDGTLDIIKASENPLMRYVSEKDNGIYDAMNKGLSDARGDYVIFLNAGDTFHTADTLQHIADVIMEYDYPGVVYGQTDIVDGRRNRIGPRHLRAPERLNLQSFAQGMVVCHQAFVALRKLAPLYNTRFRFSADYEWCIRILQHSRRTRIVPEVLIDYLCEGMTTRNRRRSLMERFRIMSYYYGFFATVMRHFKFLIRFIFHKTV